MRVTITPSGTGGISNIFELWTRPDEIVDISAFKPGYPCSHTLSTERVISTIITSEWDNYDILVDNIVEEGLTEVEASDLPGNEVLEIVGFNNNVDFEMDNYKGCTKCNCSKGTTINPARLSSVFRENKSKFVLGKGYGALLFSSVKQWAKEKGYDTLLVRPSSSGDLGLKQYYAGLGFHPLGNYMFLNY